jgi:hypothetical protein
MDSSVDAESEQSCRSESREWSVARSLRYRVLGFNLFQRNLDETLFHASSDRVEYRVCCAGHLGVDSVLETFENNVEQYPFTQHQNVNDRYAYGQRPVDNLRDNLANETVIQLGRSCVAQRLSFRQLPPSLRKTFPSHLIHNARIDPLEWAEEVHLADVDTVMAKNGVRHRQVKVDVRNRHLQEVILST